MPLLIIQLFITFVVFSSAERRTQYYYDYVIIGSGTGGSSCASRIVSKSRSTVALVEEGEYPLDPRISEARDWYSLLSDPVINRFYESIPQPGLNNRTMWQPRAKVCGGCNSHNAMVWVLGNPKDYDGWGKDNKGWKWKDLAPYWDYIVSHWGTTRLANDVYMQRILQVGLNFGYQINPDINDFKNNGPAGLSRRVFSGVMVTETDSKRTSVWTQFIEPVISKDNLDIFVNSRANKILFNGNKAIGVEIVDVVTKKITRLMARNEVIISGGVFDTPKLLMLSGVGPKSHLQQFGIPVVSNVPGVGRNLQDHTFISLSSAPLLNQTDIPDIPFGNWGALITLEDGSRYWGLTLDVNLKDFTSNCFSVYCETFHYKSRGTVTLRSADPADAPIIDPKYLSNQDDIQKTLETVKQGRKFLRDHYMAQFLEDPSKEVSPGIEVDTDEKLIEWIRNTADTDFHPAGTCKMGTENDPMAVVDHRLRVRGTRNLRVVDASIIPELTSGNPNQAILIIGLKAADMILADNQNLNEEGLVLEED